MVPQTFRGEEEKVGISEYGIQHQDDWEGEGEEDGVRVDETFDDWKEIVPAIVATGNFLSVEVLEVMVGHERLVVCIESHVPICVLRGAGGVVQDDLHLLSGVAVVQQGGRQLLTTLKNDRRSSDTNPCMWYLPC